MHEAFLLLAVYCSNITFRYSTDGNYYPLHSYLKSWCNLTLDQSIELYIKASNKSLVCTDEKLHNQRPTGKGMDVLKSYFNITGIGSSLI